MGDVDLLLPGQVRNAVGEFQDVVAAAGNVKTVASSSGTTTLSWDADSRLTGIAYPNSTTNSFTYNGLVRRVGTKDSRGTLTYTLEDDAAVSAILKGSAATYTRPRLGAGGPKRNQQVLPWRRAGHDAGDDRQHGQRNRYSLYRSLRQRVHAGEGGAAVRTHLESRSHANFTKVPPTSVPNAKASPPTGSKFLT